MEPYSIWNAYHFYKAIPLPYIGENGFEAEIVRTYSYALLVKPVPIATTVNQKSVAMSLALYIKKAVCS